MTSGLLPPNNKGLWYLGEQCGIDEYMNCNEDSGEILDVNVIALDINGLVPEKYDFGYFHGWNLNNAKKYLESLDYNRLVEELYE
jgi:hypothetical protein